MPPWANSQVPGENVFYAEHDYDHHQSNHHPSGDLKFQKMFLTFNKSTDLDDKAEFKFMAMSCSHTLCRNTWKSHSQTKPQRASDDSKRRCKVRYIYKFGRRLRHLFSTDFSSRQFWILWRYVGMQIIFANHTFAGEYLDKRNLTIDRNWLDFNFSKISENIYCLS